MLKDRWFITLLLFSVFVSGITALSEAEVAGSANYTLEASVCDGAGGGAGAPDYTLLTATAQPGIVGTGISPAYTAGYGFIAALAAQAGTERQEADVAPRTDGDGSLLVNDWVQVGRFVAGLDALTPGSEFQRADCAPYDDWGDGQMLVNDWVQAGRYVAGLDTGQPAAGPSDFLKGKQD